MILEINKNTDIEVDYGSLKINNQHIAIDTIETIIIYCGDFNLNSRLLSHNIPIIFVNKFGNPYGYYINYGKSTLIHERYHLQKSLLKELQYSLGRDIIKNKINNSFLLLKKYNIFSNRLEYLYNYINIENYNNYESLAAKEYWKKLNFTRNKNSDDPINISLNYGYTILRTMIIKYIMSKGLCPAFGIIHHNDKNNYCLADDLIEPFRVIIDDIVFSNKYCINEFDKTVKQILFNNLKNYNLKVMIPTYINDFIKVLENKKSKLVLENYICI